MSQFLQLAAQHDDNMESALEQCRLVLKGEPVTSNTNRAAFLFKCFFFKGPKCLIVTSFYLLRSLNAPCTYANHDLFATTHTKYTRIVLLDGCCLTHETVIYQLIYASCVWEEENEYNARVVGGGNMGMGVSLIFYKDWKVVAIQNCSLQCCGNFWFMGFEIHRTVRML